jgi:hypothetical protein
MVLLPHAGVSCDGTGMHTLDVGAAAGPGAPRARPIVAASTAPRASLCFFVFELI